MFFLWYQKNPTKTVFLFWVPFGVFLPVMILASTSQGILDSLCHGNSLGAVSDRAEANNEPEGRHQHFFEWKKPWPIGILAKKKYHEWIPGQFFSVSAMTMEVFFFSGVSVLGPNPHFHWFTVAQPRDQTVQPLGENISGKFPPCLKPLVVDPTLMYQTCLFCNGDF